MQQHSSRTRTNSDTVGSIKVYRNRRNEALQKRNKTKPGFLCLTTCHKTMCIPLQNFWHSGTTAKTLSSAVSPTLWCERPAARLIVLLYCNTVTRVLYIPLRCSVSRRLFFLCVANGSRVLERTQRQGRGKVALELDDLSDSFARDYRVGLRAFICGSGSYRGAHSSHVKTIFSSS